MKSLLFYIIGAIALLCASGTTIVAEETSQTLNASFYTELSRQQNKVLRSRERFLKNFIQDHPTYLPAWRSLFDIYCRSDNLEQGRTFFSSQLIMKAQKPHAQHMLALLAAISDRPSSALRYFQHSMSLSPNPSIFQDAAHFFRDSGKLPSIELLPDNLKSGPLKDRLDVIFALSDNAPHKKLLKSFSKENWYKTEDLLLAAEAAYFSKRYNAGDSLLTLGG